MNELDEITQQLKDWIRWYTWRVEYMKDEGLEDDYHEWKIKKGYIQRTPETVVPEELMEGENHE